MNILIAVDDSPHSNAALDLVKSMQWPGDTRVTVLSVSRSAVAAYSVTDIGPATWISEIDEEAMRKHQEMVARIEKDLRENSFKTSARVTPGDPRDVIVRTALEERADLVVVGSHGRTGLAKLLIGSVASHVVTHAPCSVLVARLPQAKT
jgi:nucleotide-binding universal stress UspA family protein